MLLEAAGAGGGPVLYAVPGSPRVLERTVELLVADGPPAGVDVEVVPAMSFLDLAWVRLGVDPIEEGVRLVDGHRFEVAAAGERGPLLVAHCHNQRVLSDIKLAFDEQEPERAVVLQRLGLPDESIVEVPWAELDRAVEADHLTSVYVPVAAAPVAAELVRFDELVRTLRAECPWDREQTHESLTRYLLEEAYEVLDAVASGSDEHLEEELGDLLFQVVFHAAIARERGRSPWPTSPAASTTSSRPATPTCSVTSWPRPPRRSPATGRRSRRPRRDGSRSSTASRQACPPSSTPRRS